MNVWDFTLNATINVLNHMLHDTVRIKCTSQNCHGM